jgi:hypothetical protein
MNTQYLDKLSKIIEIPYIKELNNYGVNSIQELEYIFNKIYKDYIDIEIFFKSDSYRVYDNNDQLLYSEINDYWDRFEYDTKGNCVLVQNCSYWFKREYDYNGNKIYYEDAEGDWEKYHFDENGKLVYGENNHGIIWTYDE